MSYCFDLISHPDRTLGEHLERCNLISAKLLEMKFISDSFFSKEDLEYWRKLLVFLHDFGKASDFFQYKIIEATKLKNIESFISKNNSYLEYFKNKKEEFAKKLLLESPMLSNHARIGAYMIFCNHISDNPIIELIISKIILQHHGNLSNFLNKKEEPIFLLDEENRPERINNIEKQLDFIPFDTYNKIPSKHNITVNKENWNKIKEKFSSLRKLSKIEMVLKNENTAKYFFLQHYLFSLLLSSDKGDMMLELNKDVDDFITVNKTFPTNIVDKYKSLFISNSVIVKEIDTEREKAYDNITENTKKYGSNSFFSITLPTGLGKTFCAYNAAIQLQTEFKKQTDVTPRIIYCLPFTSIIDQNAEIISSIFKSSNLSESLIAKHHYLSDYNQIYDKTELTYEAGEYLTEGWENDFIVTTFVQLFQSIFTNRNRSLRKFHNITNSIIILDEVQNVPPKYYNAIEYVFNEMATYFNTKFIFVTATQPLLFAKTKVLELSDPDKVETRLFFENRQRIVLNQSLLKSNDYQPMELDNLIEVFKSDIADNSEKSFLIICNTIAQSQEVYSALTSFTEDCVLYLSGSILPKRRKQIISLIKRNINNQKRQIIVSTQVVEAGVDIDLDIVYRDFAPLDSINQSAGRCNRNGVRGKGEVKLFNSGKAIYIYDSTLRNITEDLLRNSPTNIEEKYFYDLNEKYSKKVRKAISDFSDESNRLILAINNLQLNVVEQEFQLIKEINYYYNVFIAYNKESNKIWKEYVKCTKIEDDFERKKAIKRIKPRLLQYVTRFPNNKYEPNSDDKQKSIIKENDWKNYYNINSGFKLIDNKVIII